MKENQLLKVALAAVEGFVLMTVLLRLVKLQGLILWVVFFICVVILSLINVHVIFPRIFKVKK